ncbi:MAG: hypothetical protein KAS32_10405 [Candidatus Peribacteraceae bacterium]|nr:hypothetical protein [Candidatus Peribacteraceae bacterium]
MLNSSKGISPLIAVIMLIAFTLVVSGIFFSWTSQFAYSQRETLQICSKASIVSQNAYYNSETNRVNVVIYNTGNVPLKGFSVMISYIGAGLPKVVKDFFEKEIESDDIGLFPIEYDRNINTIVIQSLECKNAQDMISIYDVDGL